MIECKYSDAVSRMNRPSRLALAVCSSENGPANIITLGWFMRTSITPPMFAISVGLFRYSHELLSKYRNFVLAIPSVSMAEITMKCGMQSGRDIDKFKEFQIATRKGKLSPIPLLTDAVANFECKTITQVRSGDHTIFVGEVKYAWQYADKTLEQLFSIPSEDDRFEALIRNGGFALGKIKGM